MRSKLNCPMCMSPTRGKPVCGRCGSALVTGITDVESLRKRHNASPDEVEHELKELMARRKKINYRPGPSTLAPLELFVTIGEDEVPLGNPIPAEQNGGLAAPRPTPIAPPRPHEPRRPSEPDATPVPRQWVQDSERSRNAVGRWIAIAATVALLVAGAVTAGVFALANHTQNDSPPAPAASGEQLNPEPAPGSNLPPAPATTAPVETLADSTNVSCAPFQDERRVRRSRHTRLKLSGKHGFDEAAVRARSRRGYLRLTRNNGRSERIRLDAKPLRIKRWHDEVNAREVLVLELSSSEHLLIELSNGQVHSEALSADPVVIQADSGCELAPQAKSAGLQQAATK